MKPSRVIGVSTILFAVLVFAAGAAWAPAATTRVAAGSKTFPDSAAEQAGAPDITSVTVSNTNAGGITFKINGPPQFTEDMLVDIIVDADNNPSTGSPASDVEAPGGEYAIEMFGGEANLFKWDGENYSRRASDPPQSSLTHNQLSITISAAELGNTK